MSPKATRAGEVTPTGLRNKRRSGTPDVQNIAAIRDLSRRNGWRALGLSSRRRPSCADAGTFCRLNLSLMRLGFVRRPTTA